MGKMKEQCIQVMELIQDGVTPRQAALFMGMSVDEVVKIMEIMGYYEDPTEFDYEQT
jgi:hypothetical protein